MKHIILILMFPLFCSIGYSQTQSAEQQIEDLVRQGITFHDKGDFDNAIKFYDKALEIDNNSFLVLSEKAMTLVSLQRYNEAIEHCRKAIEISPNHKLAAFTYVTYGTAHDLLQQPEKSLEVYEKGITLFPNYSMLYFNKAITLTKMNQIDEAILSLKQALYLKPTHPGSHNALARLLEAKNQRIPAILAYCRFLTLELRSQRAEENLGYLQKTMNANVRKKEDNSIQIFVNPKVINDTASAEFKSELDFLTLEMLLSIDAAMDHVNDSVNKTEFSIFLRKIKHLFSVLKAMKSKGSGFYWNYYVPFFIEMHEKNFVEAFAYAAYTSKSTPETSQWIKENQQLIKDYINWSTSYEWPKK